MIIRRYLIKEIINALFAVTLVLLLIFLSNQLVRFLNYAAVGKIATNVVLKLIGFEIPYLLTLILPLGLYLGIILAYGRLYAENELPVLHACGFSYQQLIRFTLSIALIVALAVLLLAGWVNPRLAAKKAEVIATGLSHENIVHTLQPGRFQVSKNGQRVIYAEQVYARSKRAQNVFLAEQKTSVAHNNHAWVVVSAIEAYQVKNHNTHQTYIVSRDGYRYDGTPGNNNYQVTGFKHYAVRIPPASTVSAHLEQEAIPTFKLFQNYHINNIYAAELQWRLSLPLSVLLLAPLAIFFSQVGPRQGRYSYLVPAVVVYLVYINLLFLARNWLEMDAKAHGLWWAHGLMLLVIAAFVFLPKCQQLIRMKRA